MLPKTSKGSALPHVACECGVPLEVVSASLKVLSDAAKGNNRNGYTLLHVACECGTPLEVLSALLKV
eukprot:8519551-Ditylum_brightwellii.AAC.1